MHCKPLPNLCLNFGAMRVFRDQSDLSLVPNLWGKIETALSESEFFVLLASPESAASPWVNKELDHWISNNGIENILIVLTDGIVQWDDNNGDFDWQWKISTVKNFCGTRKRSDSEMERSLF